MAGDFLSVVEMARLLKRRVGLIASKVPTRELPNLLVRVAAVFKPEVRPLVPDLGKMKNATSAKARRLLGWSPRSAEEALVATAESLSRLHLLKPGG